MNYLKSVLLVVLVVVLSLMGFSQQLMLVEFDDKGDEYNINNPSEFLSERAIQRRIQQGIDITVADIPVAQSYLDELVNNGSTIHVVSRWLNCALVINNSDKVGVIEALPFVKRVKLMSRPEQRGEKPFFAKESYEPVTTKQAGQMADFNYGNAANQINMLNGVVLHEQGFTGTGMLVAVLDAGFSMADTHPAFSKLFAEGRVKATRDYVEWGNDIFRSDISSHGTSVLSCMAANAAGQMVGTAPDANYVLIRTEDAPSEYLGEEYFWVAGAEYADSLGVDVINSSLGYTTFDNPAEDHVYADLDGNTTPITIGADMAAQRGILVVNSAGNSGDSPWKYIGAPADGDSVLTVGAVNGSGQYVSFSSQGPSADGRVKPNVVAQGGQTFVATPGGGYANSNGTSFSSPVMAGMVTSLWQAMPQKNNYEIIQLLESQSSNYTTPDDFIGYGIPDFGAALATVGTHDRLVESPAVWPNPLTGDQFVLRTDCREQCNIVLYDVTGKVMMKKRVQPGRLGKIEVQLPGGLAKGTYFVHLYTSNEAYSVKIIK